MIIKKCEPWSEKAAEPAAETKPKVATEARPTKHRKSKLKYQQNFMTEIKADEEDTNYEIFFDYFKYQNSLLLVKDSITSKQAENEKLTPKQMLQILLIALPQAKAGNTCKKLLNEIRQIIYFLYQ